jgi:GntR family L-lactate dehydrogenase operon transcriptional regulator
MAMMNAIIACDSELARKAVGEHIEFVIKQVAKIDEATARRQRVSRLATDVF